jgi:RNA polymerase sigma-70 factor (ECF subfamily)
MIGATLDANAIDEEWLRRFHRGEREVIRQLYVDYFATVSAAIASVVDGPDRETVIHEVFVRLIERAEMRESFRGGSVAAWLTTIARNRAIDLVRRRKRETAAIDEVALDPGVPTEDRSVAATARRQLAAFRVTLPAEWRAIFDACFVEQRSQRDAARSLGIARTTLAYRELQIRRRLRRFVLEDRHD